MFIETCEGEIINLNHVVSARTFAWEPKDKFRFKMAYGIEIVETRTSIRVCRLEKAAPLSQRPILAMSS